MIKTTDFTYLSTNRSNNIHTTVWDSDNEPKAVIQIVHGVAEHIGRYNKFAEYMASQNYVILGNDHLGHGKSVADESELGWFGDHEGWNMVVGDVRKLHDIIREKHPNVPLVLFGHSMGSFIARTYIAEYPDDYDLCILSGTGFQSSLTTSLGMSLAKGEIRKHSSKYRSSLLQNIAFGSYLRGIQDPIGKNDWISRDKNVIRAYDADPLCGYTATAGLMYDMMDGIHRICNPAFISGMNNDLPVLFISGEADPVGNWGKGIRKCEKLFKDAGMRDVTVKLYPNARHEVLNEINHQEVWKDVSDWISRKLDKIKTE